MENLQVRGIATGYSYFMNFGISYSFGSIFNSTVNPRFGGFDGFFCQISTSSGKFYIISRRAR